VKAEADVVREYRVFGAVRKLEVFT